MATLSSSLVLTLKDGVTKRARGISAALAGINRQNATFGATAFGSVRNMVLLGAGYLGVSKGMDSTIGSAMKFESAMADLAKKSTLTEFQLGKMEKRITQLSNSMPLAKTEIAGLIAQAAQFGIANDELERFALLGAKAAVAFDMEASSTAESLSKLKNAYGLTIDGLSSLADAINFTADSAGTSEQRVIDFLLRTGASAKQYGISAQEMAAFGATLNEIGIESAKAGTGMNAMMAKLAGLTKNKKAVKALDAVAGKGYSAKLQKQFFDRPVDAMKEFFGLVKKMPAQRRAGMLIDFFGLEYQDDAAAIANNIDRITQRLETLTDASKYAGSVEKTFRIFADTTEQKLRVLRNNVLNISQAFGAHLLPQIAAFSDKVVGALGTMEKRVSVIDRMSASVNGFISGLGLESKTLGGVLNEGFDLLFGKLDGAQAAGERMGRIFDRMQGWGENARWFAGGVADLGNSILKLTGLDASQIGSVLMAVGGFGFKLMLASVGISMVARAIWSLAKGLAFLSGLSAAVGILKTVGKVGLAIFGGGAGAAAVKGAAKAGTGAAGAAGGAAAATGLRGFLSALGLGSAMGALASGVQSLGDTPGSTFEDQVRNQRKFREFLQGIFGIGKAKPASGPGQFGSGAYLKELKSVTGGADAFKGMRPAGNDNKPDEVSILGTPRVTITNPMQPPQIHVAVTVHATTNADAAEIGDQVAERVGRKVADALSGLQADQEWSVA